MQVEWQRMKKNPAFHLLDFAILLALLRGMGENVFTNPTQEFADFINHGEPIAGLMPVPIHGHHQRWFGLKMAELNHDAMGAYQTIMEDAHRRLPLLQNVFNNGTGNDTILGQNVTALILQVNLNEEEDEGTEIIQTNGNAANTNELLGATREENIAIFQDPVNMLEPRLDIFDYALENANDNIYELLFNAPYNNEEYINADDVRWRDYLRKNDEPEKHCEDNALARDNCSDVTYLDDTKITTDETHRCRTTSEVSDESGIEVTDNSEVKVLDNADEKPEDEQQEINAQLQVTPLEDLIAFEQDVTLANSDSIEDADLMQLMYEQDADLGFSWHHLDEPVKQIKDIDDLPKEKNYTLDTSEFFVDGETGEQIPIHQNTTSLNNTAAPIQTPGNISGNNQNTLNIDECLEILESSIDDMQPYGADNFTSARERNNMIRNLTSLIDTTDNNTSYNADQDIWRQINGLSEMTGLNLQTRANPPVPPTQNLFNTNLEPATPQQQVMEQALNDYNQGGYSPVEQRHEPVFEQHDTQIYKPISNFPSPTYPLPVQTPPTYLGSPVTSDGGMPMEVGFPSPERQGPNFHFGRFENFSFGSEAGRTPPFGESPSSLASLPEPGLGFFDMSPKSDVSSNFSEFLPVNTSIPPLTNTTVGSYLNPPLVPNPPPPLTISPPVVGFPDTTEQVMSSTIDETIISEYCDSDSGVSSEHSPGGFDCVGSNTLDEVVFNGVPYVKAEAHDLDQTFQMQDMKSIQHNHTYNGTAGVPKQNNKKKEKASQPRESRDERKARELNLPFTLDEIILSPVEDYNEMLVRTPLSPAQQALIKDIRRRGKNKVAAQNCRKRKIETITTIEEDVELLRSRKQQLMDERKELDAKQGSMKMLYNSLYQHIFSSLRDESGRPYDSNHFRLEQVEGAALLVPRMQGENQTVDHGNTSAQLDFTKVTLEETQ